MSSVDSLQVRSLLKKGKIGQITSDSPVALRIKFVGGGSVTSVTNTAATDLVLIGTNAAGTSETVTSTYSTDTTIGAVADRINASANWEARVLDTVRTMATDSSELGVDTGVLSTTTYEGVPYYDIHTDTSVAQELSYRITYDRHVGVNKPKRKKHRVTLQEFVYYATLGTAAADGIQIWECDGTVETQLYSALSISAVATTTNWASGEGYITANDGNDIVVSLVDSGTITDSTDNYLNVTGFLE